MSSQRGAWSSFTTTDLGIRTFTTSEFGTSYSTYTTTYSAVTYSDSGSAYSTDLPRVYTGSVPSYTVTAVRTLEAQIYQGTTYSGMTYVERNQVPM